MTIEEFYQKAQSYRDRSDKTKEDLAEAKETLYKSKEEYQFVLVHGSEAETAIYGKKIEEQKRRVLLLSNKVKELEIARQKAKMEDALELAKGFETDIKPVYIKLDQELVKKANQLRTELEEANRAVYENRSKAVETANRYNSVIESTGVGPKHLERYTWEVNYGL